MLKKLIRGIIIFLGVIILFLLTVVAPIDFTPLDQSVAVRRTFSNLETLKLETSEGNEKLKVGWSIANITPLTPINMAGYGPRGPYNAVEDSLFVRSVVFNNGEKELVFISLDLLMFPRLVKDAIYEKLETYGFSKNEIFLTATHTHNGFGNWEKSIVGKAIFGEFDEDNFNNLVSKIIESVVSAKKDASEAEIAFQKINARELVINRISGEQGTVDPYLRVIRIKKQNGRQGMIVSFAAHAVNLDADIWTLSRDYPGILVDNLENDPTIDFSVFCAGMVASHNIRSEIPKGPARIKNAADLLTEKILSQTDSLSYSANALLGATDLDVELPPSQLRLTGNLRIRDWLFRVLMGPLRADIKIMEIGDILFLGMPGDFSGEISVNDQLDEYAEKHNKKLFITGFNGNYIGYITDDAHYASCTHDEVRTMNWVGPYKGEYFSTLIKKIIVAGP